MRVESYAFGGKKRYVFNGVGGFLVLLMYVIWYEMCDVEMCVCYFLSDDEV